MATYVQSPPSEAFLEKSSRDTDWLGEIGISVSRYSLVLILLWIGMQKFTAAEAEGIKPLISHSPFMSWMYAVLSVQGASNLIGCVEIVVALLLALRPLSAKASFVGSVGAVFTFLGTTSFLFSTPGVIDHNYAIPLLGAVGGFLIKDLVLLGAAVLTASEARIAIRGTK